MKTTEPLGDQAPEPAPLRTITIRFIGPGERCEAHPERPAIVELECHEDGSKVVPRLVSCVECLEEWASSYLDDHAINAQAVYDAAAVAVEAAPDRKKRRTGSGGRSAGSANHVRLA